MGAEFRAIAISVMFLAGCSFPPPDQSKAARDNEISTRSEPSRPGEARPSGNSQVAADRSDLSAATRTFAALYDELNRFRRDPEFLRSGFNPCCRYSDWLRRVEALDRANGAALLRELRASPRELISIGRQYARNNGNPTPLSQSISARIDLALGRSQPPQAGGVAQREGWWCRNIETSFASLRALEDGDYARSSNMRSDPACPHVLPNTATGPALERRYYSFRDGSGQMGFARVRLPNGVEVWAPLTDIEFR